MGQGAMVEPADSVLDGIRDDEEKSVQGGIIRGTSEKKPPAAEEACLSVTVSYMVHIGSLHFWLCVGCA